MRYVTLSLLWLTVACGDNGVGPDGESIQVSALPGDAGIRVSATSFDSHVVEGDIIHVTGSDRLTVSILLWAPADFECLPTAQRIDWDLTLLSADGAAVDENSGAHDCP